MILDRHTIILIGLFFLVTSTSQLSAQSQVGTDPTTNMAIATDICLQNARTPDAAPVAFSEAGFTLKDADEGTYNFEAAGVAGFVAPLVTTEWCWIESRSLTFLDVQEIGHERASIRYPEGVFGKAQRGELANGCPSMTIVIANRLAMLEFRNAGFWEGCDDPATGGILFR